MKHQATSRKWMIAVGILAALTILFSPAFEREATRIITETNAEAAKNGTDEKQIVNVPSDAVTSSQAVEVESANPFVIQEIITEDEHQTAPALPRIAFPTSVVTTFLRSVISPQAP
jgi:hypothetical protein